MLKKKSKNVVRLEVGCIKQAGEPLEQLSLLGSSVARANELPEVFPDERYVVADARVKPLRGRLAHFGVANNVLFYMRFDYVHYK